jgi:hypothetical protein
MLPKVTPTSNIVSVESDLNMSFESVAVNSYQMTVILIDRAAQSVRCELVNAEDNLTFSECSTIIQDKAKIAMVNVEFRAKI